ncbi:hypothetical protein [Desulfosporosinus youngiae]|uniref:Lipoprotein n=1 Tax=Desulfosporosinus youngiae DSM 17734 TaxID=768710 RepID=H5XWW4_9FIRM|nr:hypothetical protein [Desulfosporosinus youngiae]EHQ90763.1 hypothetical protein DesyoDRAFT_3777 [Desulfosporosinus youngiae DSM 17734]
MRKLLLLTMLFFLPISLVTGCAPQQSELMSDDVEVMIQIVPFSSVCEYRTYFGLNHLDDKYSHPDDKHTVLSQKTKQVIISWELNPEIRANDLNRLYYGPYIIIILPKDEWEYADTTHIAGNSFRRTFNSEIVTNILKDYPEYNWASLETFGWFFHAKSFDQETIHVAFKKRTDSSDEGQSIVAYYIYFDPITKHGWAKKIGKTII